MKMLRSFPFGKIVLMTIAVISVILSCGFGFPMSLNSIGGNIENGSELTANDSIVFDIIEILKEEKNLGVERREEIEKKIRAFPDRIIRRDTSTYFLQTVLGIAYNEFVSEDYDKAIEIASEFSNNVVEQNPFSIPIKYGLIKFTSFRIKDKEDSVPSKGILNFVPSPEFNRNQSVSKFIVGFLPDLPLNLNLETYHYLLSVFKEAGGFPKLVGSSIDNNFFELCEKANRGDILECARILWELDENILENIHKKSEIDYSLLEAPKGFEDNIPSSKTIDLDNIRKLREFALQIYDADGNIEEIDSLILLGKLDSIGKYMDNYQNIKLSSQLV